MKYVSYLPASPHKQWVRYTHISGHYRTLPIVGYGIEEDGDITPLVQETTGFVVGLLEPLMESVDGKNWRRLVEVVDRPETYHV